MLPGGYSHYLLDGLSIVVIDLLLAGDNALVIAMAVRALPKPQRRVALMSGAGLAVLIRVAVTFLAAKLLRVEFLQFAGGAFVLWIAVRVLADASAPERTAPSPRGLWRAVGSIIIADLTMSTDNILAVAGASKGNAWLILFGLALRGRRRLLLAMTLLVLTYNFVNLNLARPDVANHATRASFGFFVEPGYLATDISQRLALEQVPL